MQSSLLTGDAPASSTAWWLAPSELAAQFAEQTPTPRLSGRYRFGKRELVLRSNYLGLMQSFHEFWGDCRTESSQPAGTDAVVATIVRTRGSPFALLTLEHPGIALDDLAFDLLHQIFARDPVKNMREVPSSAEGWRLAVPSEDPQRPVVAVSRHRALVDVSWEPWMVLSYLAISAALRLQRDVIFLHAGSVAIGGAGVLLAGESGTGKTTQALALVARGHEFFGDDLAAIEPETREILPFRRIGRVRQGPRATDIDALVEERDLKPGAMNQQREPRIYLRVGRFFPQGVRHERAPLRFAFFMRERGATASLRRFDAATADEEAVFEPLTANSLAATSWGPAGANWRPRYRQLRHVLSGAQCFYVDSGTPDETADLIERTVMEGLSCSR